MSIFAWFQINATFSIIDFLLGVLAVPSHSLDGFAFRSLRLVDVSLLYNAPHELFEQSFQFVPSTVERAEDRTCAVLYTQI